MKNSLFKHIICFGVIFILFLLNSSLAIGFSVATLYGENYPLRMRPGEIKDTFFLLRNVVEGDSDVIIKSELIKGGEIAELVEGSKNYEVLAGREAEVPIRVKIPEDTPIGTRYKVAAMFKPLPGKEAEGNIQFLVNIGKSFPVIIVDDKKHGESRGSFTLTLEGEPEEIIEKSAPSTKGKTVWFVIITILLFSIIIMMLVIILLLRKNRMQAVQTSQIGQISSSSSYQQ